MPLGRVEKAHGQSMDHWISQTEKSEKIELVKANNLYIDPDGSDHGCIMAWQGIQKEEELREECKLYSCFRQFPHC